MHRAKLATIVACWLPSLCALDARAEDNIDEARKVAQTIARTAAIEYLTDREFQLDGEQIAARGHAVEPKEHVKVDIRAFELLPGRADLKLHIDARFRFEGKLTQEETETEFRGEADIGQLIAVEARFTVNRDGVQVDARATDVQFSVKLREVYPADAAGGKDALTKLLAQQLKRQRDELLREFNDWLREYCRKHRFGPSRDDNSAIVLSAVLSQNR